jgi:hypothetical protein
MSEFYDLAQRGLLESIELIDEEFTWKDKPYGCIIDRALHFVTTAKSFFIVDDAPVYPECGDEITIGGKKFQITARGNAAERATESGFAEDQPFIDDPADPALDLVFDHFVK